MLLGYVIFYVPLALIAALLLIYFQDLGLKLILGLAAVWLLSFWLIPEFTDLSRSSIFVMPGDTNVRLRSIFAGIEGVIATVMFLVGKFRNWVV